MAAENSDIDAWWMSRCAVLAGVAEANGHTPVGAIIVLGGRSVAEASEQSPNGSRAFAHAELLAVEFALMECTKDELGSATLYSTAEPCLLCGYAIREAGVGRIVIGRAVGDIGSVGGRFPVLTTLEIEDWGTPPEVVWWWGSTK